MADHLLAVLREALTNVGKHAEATRCTVTISVADDVSLEVSDNGAGIEVRWLTVLGWDLSTYVAEPKN